MCFVSRLLTSGTLNADQDILETIIKSLTEMVEKPLSLRDHQEREQTWLDLMSSGKLSHITSKSMLEMALKSKCYRIAEILYEKNGKYIEILNCYLHDVYRKSEVFNYMRLHAEDPKRYIKSQLITNIKTLIDIDSHQSASLVIEYFPELLETLCDNLKASPDQMYAMLYEIQLSETSLPPELAEKYLELLLNQNSSAVESFIKSGNCRPEQALVIAQRAKHNQATAFFLEQVGDFIGALELLLDDPVEEKSILQAASLCARGASHLDAKQAEQLWLKLLKKSPNHEVLRQLLHSAAQHVRLSVLLEVINSAKMGDIKNLLQGLMSDAAHETLMLETTLKILSNDLHQSEFTSNLFSSYAPHHLLILILSTCCLTKSSSLVLSSDQTIKDKKHEKLWGYISLLYILLDGIDEYFSTII